MKIIERSLKSSDGLTLFATEWAPDGKAPTACVALVHGLGEHIGRYHHVAQAFTDAGFAMMGIDLRGHGKSEGPRGHSPSYEQLTKDVSMLIESLRKDFPGLPVFVYGHSMGGNIALYYAIKVRPDVQGFIITSPGLATKNPVPAGKLFLGKVMANIAPSFAMDNGLDLSGLSRDQIVIEKYKNDPLVHGKISAKLAIDMLEAGKFELENASSIDLPLLLMVGSSDRLVDPEKVKLFAKTSKNNVTFKLYENYYHELHNEPEKAEVISTMIDWINNQIK
ncbi:MAG: alpha/beta hydrolase [Anaerolineaceae bacterium]|nr:alpha/beta hydrolase [Anaerolineaceae bacterium]